MIKAIIFDIGEVILDLDPITSIEAFRSRAGFESIDEFLDTSHQRGIFRQMEEGAINEEEFYEVALTYCRPGTSKETIRECFYEFMPGIPQYKIELLRELSKDYDLYILSNNNPISRAYTCELARREGLDFDEIFKKQYYSYEMKMMKPCRKIFLTVLEEIGLPPEEILYVEDSISNVQAAEALGINTLHYIPRSDLRAEIAKKL